MEAPTRLIIADDDKEILQLLSEFLTKHNYQVSTTQNGEELLKALNKDPAIKLVILDVMMPGKDGLQLCREIRQQSNVCIIMLTAAGSEADKIIGLEFGADDYLAKPFNSRELLARIRAVLRRLPDQSVTSSVNGKATHKSLTFQFEDWRLDTGTRTLFSPSNVMVPLSVGTYDLLIVFLEHPQRVLSRDFLLDLTKNRNAEPFDRSIDIQVSRLRQRLEEDPKDPQMIKTVRSGGYLFTPKVVSI